MAKFVNKDLRLKDNQNVTWGDGLDVNMWFDGTQFRVDSTVSGVTPTQDYHLTTKLYVDDAITSISGGNFDHGLLSGLGDDDHTHYTLVDGTRDFTGIIEYNAHPTFVDDTDIVDKKYVDDEIATLSGSMVMDHGGLTGLGDDDHTQYSLVNGTRSFTGVVGGITPTLGAHLTTKDYVDSLVSGLEWQESVIDILPVASGTTTSGNRYIASATGGGWTEDNIYEYNGSSWDETVVAEGYASWVTEQDALYVYNGTDWVRFGSTITHNNLSGLQGGTSGEYYHLTSAEESGLTGGGDTTLHIHDGRYYTETELDSMFTALSGTYAPLSHDHPSTDITDFTEASQDAVGNAMSGAGSVSVNYDDGANTITISGTTAGEIEHHDLNGLGDDDHTQYILTTGSRAFTGEVAGIDPTVSGSLATKAYVDAQNTAQTSIYEHGRQAIGNGASSVSVVFNTSTPSTNYTVNCTMENTNDSPPSIYPFIVSAKTTSGFTVSFSGDIDSANYYLDWSVVLD